MTEHATDITVRGYHLDMYGHVNNARYLEFLEEARWAAYEKVIVHPDFQARGWVFLVVNINISYRSPAGFGEVLHITTNMEKLGTTSATLRQRIVEQRSGREVVDAAVTFVVFDNNTQKPVPVEGELSALFEQA